ncbi:MAG: DUF1365 domain-containing protein [Leptospira sp.]|nr:DUF1365 domain-containing protein [Leptospira sp.]
MDLNSKIYHALVTHSRTFPIRNHFTYKVGTFLLDLDELDELNRSVWFFGKNSFSLFSFWDKDHLHFGEGSLKEQVSAYLKASGIDTEIAKIYLNTNLRVLGYVFNPVCFYFCFDKNGKQVCSIAEVGNTFGEIKPYIGKVDHNAKGTISNPETYLRVKKNFYVSPFIPIDSEFEFLLNFPKDTLHIGVNSWENDKRVLTTAFIGEKKSFSSWNLFILFCRYPFITVQIIVLIHWQAFRLWTKRLPYIKKNENLDHQTGVTLGEVSKPVSLAKFD